MERMGLTPSLVGHGPSFCLLTALLQSHCQIQKQQGVTEEPHRVDALAGRQITAGIVSQGRHQEQKQKDQRRHQEQKVQQRQQEQEVGRGTPRGRQTWSPTP